MFQLRANRPAAQARAAADLPHTFTLHEMADQPPLCSFWKVLKRLMKPISRPVVAPLNAGIGELIEEEALPAISPGAVLGCWLVKADQVALLMGVAGLLPTLERDTEGLRQLG